MVAVFDKLCRLVYIIAGVVLNLHIVLRMMQQHLLIECRGSAK